MSQIRGGRGQGLTGPRKNPTTGSADALAHEYGRLLIGSLDHPGFGAFVAAPVGKGQLDRELAIMNNAFRMLLAAMMRATSWALLST